MMVSGRHHVPCTVFFNLFPAFITPYFYAEFPKPRDIGQSVLRGCGFGQQFARIYSLTDLVVEKFE